MKPECLDQPERSARAGAREGNVLRLVPREVGCEGFPEVSHGHAHLIGHGLRRNLQHHSDLPIGHLIVADEEEDFSPPFGQAVDRILDELAQLRSLRLGEGTRRGIPFR